ncbi:uncharacterized protein LOC118200640 [Stegodyphus dumicola]|uniref:uncharacterized protein LOC118200640 n=1 Tax=Stegodyphus dumicola TaxID=202533 RepID=UPI0015B1A41F|nr:uncharacterized protein LOC118200640 [Stegodyphus dumicola]
MADVFNSSWALFSKNIWSSEPEMNDDFVSDDLTVLKLYRKEAYAIAEKYDIEICDIMQAIVCMKQAIAQGHKNKFRNFAGIDFNKPVNRSAYLIRYAACHTGLVKQAMWRIFHRKPSIFLDILLSRVYLNVVSLGGGPGSDIIGFCSALQEFSNCINFLHLTVVDIKAGWVGVLQSIIDKVICCEFKNFSFSQMLKDVSVCTRYVVADLTNETFSENEDLMDALGVADVVLMVKLTSFLPPEEKLQLILNVSEVLHKEAMLIFIDCPYPSECFEQAKSIVNVYEEQIKYDLDNSALGAPVAIESSKATVAVFKRV